jgi:phosphatidylinositol-3-phosphatase
MGFKKLILIISILLLQQNLICAQIPPAHIVVVIIENKTYNEIVANASAPYINSLINNGHTALFTQSLPITHPSQPNYLILFSGSTQGVTNDYVPLNTPFTSPNLGSEIINSGFTFSGYSEDLNYIGSLDSISLAYVRKHNPWVNWQGSGANGIPANLNERFIDFPTDYNQLPTISFVIPNVNHDMHDSSITIGDTWLHNNLDGYIQWCINNNSLFILTTDEIDNTLPPTLLTFITGANIKAGFYAQPITHYNILKTIEDLYSLPAIGEGTDSSAVNSIWLTTLALQLINFDASQTNNNVTISWETSGQIDVEKFSIERSDDDQTNFKSIGSIDAPGIATVNNIYQFIDHSPLPGVEFYRLKETDLDNKIQYSKIIAVIIPVTKITYRVYPTPSENFTSIFSDSPEEQMTSVQILSVNGKIITQVIAKLSSNSPLKLNLTTLAKGVYFVKIMAGSTSSIKKIIVR